MASENVAKLVGPLPNQKMMLSTVRADTRSITRGPGTEVEDIESEYRPIRGDYPEVMLQHQGNRILVTSGWINGAPIPGKTPRPAQYRKSHTGMVSARSKRELRAIIAASDEGNGSLICHNIQVRDDGRYFVYADDSLSSPTLDSEECVSETPQRISDLPPETEEC